MKKILAVAAIAAFAVSPVVAADLVIADDVSAAPVSSDWSGFYAGVFGGYGSGTATAESVLGITEIDGSGALLGVTVGGNAQFDGFVLGLEGDVAWAGIEGDAACTGAPGFTCGGTVDWMGSLRARAGVAVDQVLLYATAGAAFAGVTATVTPVGAFTGEFSDTFIGWTAGVGAEMKVTDDISVKAEYAYVDLGTRTAPAGTLSTLNATDLSPAFHTVKLGVIFAF